MLPVGASIAAATRVSNLLGASKPFEALIASRVSILSATFLSICVGSTLYFVRPHTYFPSFFDADERVASEAARTIPFLSLYVIADGIQVALNGVVKGCGRQPLIMPIVIVSYWFIGLPLAYHFTFIVNEGTTVCDEDQHFCGIAGLVAGEVSRNFLWSYS